MDERRRYARGLAVRREVLGDAYVDRALAARTAFDAEMQDLITRHAWGEIWTRPRLPRRTRSLVTIAAMVALNRPEELQLHLGAALRNGVTPAEIKEVLLQMAVYCGLPAANSAFHLASELLRQEKRARQSAPAAKGRSRRRRSKKTAA